MPTFRGPGGLWRSFRPEDLATPEAFVRDPRLCWEWYLWRRELVMRCRPNAAHRAIARWMLRRPGVSLVTQNVDGLHELAANEEAGGADAAGALPVRLHGSIFAVKCTRCSYQAEDRSTGPLGDNAPLPHCPSCAAILRPDVVWFGESLPRAELRRAEDAAASAQVCLVIGTQGAVYPAAGLVFQARDRAGARIIVVDPGETAFDGIADLRIQAPAGIAIPQLLLPSS